MTVTDGLWPRREPRRKLAAPAVGYASGMEISARLFASFRQAVGADRLSVELGPEVRVRDLLSALRQAHPEVGPGLASAMVAVNLEYVGPDYRLEEGDEVAIIPPVSGGGA